MTKLLLTTAVLFFCTSCATLLPNRPNRPGTVDMVRRVFDPVSGQIVEEVSAEVKNDENPKKGIEVASGRSGLSVNTGSSAPFDWSNFSFQPVVIAGIGIFVLGIGLIVLSKYPLASFVVPAGCGWWVSGAGLVLIAWPAMVEGLRQLVVPAAVLGAVIGMIYYARKLKWFERATDVEAQNGRLAKGDVGGAAAMAFLNSGGDTDMGKLVRIRANGSGTTP